MKLDIQDILERVEQTKSDRRGYINLARRWEKDWAMDIFDMDSNTRLTEEGKEQVVLPTVYNAVHLAQRLLGATPSIEVPVRGKTDADMAAAKTRERWLSAAWQTTYQQKRRNLIQDASWQLYVRGRAVFRVQWVYKQLPKAIRDKRFPILIDTLDPVDCGFHDGPLYTEYAYSSEKMPASLVAQMYPKAAIDKITNAYAYRPGAHRNEEVEVTDFWYTAPNGNVWHAVLGNNQIFLREPKKTDYPIIPLIEAYGDSAGVPSETYRGLSLIHPMSELYRYQCRLASQMATGVMYYMWPLLLLTNEYGERVDPEFSLKPGGWEQLPTGTNVQQMAPNPNVPLAQSIATQVDSALQQSGFPGVMFGEAPGDLQAGYGINLLGEAARGRIALFRQSLEYAIMSVNELMLSLVETFGPMHLPGGVTVYGKSASDQKSYHVTLTPEDILGHHENIVTIKPTVPQDEAQRLTLFMRMVEQGLVSPDTFRDMVLDLDLPEDEQWRVWLAQTLNSQELRPKVQIATLMQHFPDDWMEWIKGTPLEQVAMAMLGMPPQPQPGMQGPPGMPPGGMPPGGMPPGMPPGGAPAPMPQPPSMAMPADILGGAVGASPMQPQNPAAGAGMPPGIIPPELAGQLTPEMMGDPNMDPAIFAAMMGQPLTPGEQDRQILR